MRRRFRFSARTSSWICLGSVAEMCRGFDQAGAAGRNDRIHPAELHQSGIDERAVSEEDPEPGRDCSGRDASAEDVERCRYCSAAGALSGAIPARVVAALRRRGPKLAIDYLNFPVPSSSPSRWAFQLVRAPKVASVIGAALMSARIASSTLSMLAGSWTT